MVKYNWMSRVTGSLEQYHSFSVVFLSSMDSRKVEQSLVRGGRTCDGPLNIVSHGLSDGAKGISGI